MRRFSSKSPEFLLQTSHLCGILWGELFFNFEVLKLRRSVLKTSQRIRTVLSHACIYFTTASLALYTGGMLASGIERQWIPTLSMMYAVFAFSVLFSAVNQIVWNTRLAGVLKILIHYAATTAIFYVMFILWGSYTASPSSVLIILMAYTLIYAAAFLFIFLLRYIFSSKKNNASAYSSQFSHTK